MAAGVVAFDVVVDVLVDVAVVSSGCDSETEVVGVAVVVDGVASLVVADAAVSPDVSAEVSSAAAAAFGVSPIAVSSAAAVSSAVVDPPSVTESAVGAVVSREAGFARDSAGSAAGAVLEGVAVASGRLDGGAARISGEEDPAIAGAGAGPTGDDPPGRPMSGIGVEPGPGQMTRSPLRHPAMPADGILSSASARTPVDNVIAPSGAPAACVASAWWVDRPAAPSITSRATAAAT